MDGGKERECKKGKTKKDGYVSEDDVSGMPPYFSLGGAALGIKKKLNVAMRWESLLWFRILVYHLLSCTLCTMYDVQYAFL